MPRQLGGRIRNDLEPPQDCVLDQSMLEERRTPVADSRLDGCGRPCCLADARSGRGASERRRAIEAPSRSRMRGNAAATRRLPVSISSNSDVRSSATISNRRRPLKKSISPAAIRPTPKRDVHAAVLPAGERPPRQICCRETGLRIRFRTFQRSRRNCFSYVKHGMRESRLTGIAGGLCCGWVRSR